ncbi:MAG: DUF2148 domain-containing protein [Candidatus Bathyarchaeia archaeon]
MEYEGRYFFSYFLLVATLDIGTPQVEQKPCPYSCPHLKHLDIHRTQLYILQALIKALQAGLSRISRYREPTCVFKALNLGVALGSAIEAASMLNINNRIMYRIGARRD